jgi:hypothetical protein
MYRRFHDRFGTAGVVIAVIALVAALGGTAIAAKGALTGKQKREVEKIAKKFAGKPGSPGPAGSNGTNGKDGPPGPNGTGGINGSNGADGASVVLLNETPLNCDEGGFTYEIEGSAEENEVCNGESGEDGEPWTVGAAPSGALMKGTWALSANATAASEALYTPLSTTVPLGGVIQKVLKGGESFVGVIECPASGTAANPAPAVLVASGEPANGVVCVYPATESNLTFSPIEAKLSNSKGGVVLQFDATAAGPATAYGSWAMYAP